MEARNIFYGFSVFSRWFYPALNDQYEQVLPQNQRKHPLKRAIPFVFLIPHSSHHRTKLKSTKKRKQKEKTIKIHNLHRNAPPSDIPRTMVPPHSTPWVNKPHIPKKGKKPKKKKKKAGLTFHTPIPHRPSAFLPFRHAAPELRRHPRHDGRAGGRRPDRLPRLRLRRRARRPHDADRQDYSTAAAATAGTAGTAGGRG